MFQFITNRSFFVNLLIAIVLGLAVLFIFFQLLDRITQHGKYIKVPEIKGKHVDEAKRLLEYLGLSHRINHKPGGLSGGEQQRVAVARALVNDPKIILADEPTGNLDSTHARELHQLFFDLRKQFNQTFLIVTHNEELAAQCDRTVHMKDGRIVAGAN